MATRILLRSGVASVRAVPVWWPGQLSTLDTATLARIGVLVVGASDEGDEGKAAEAMRAVARAGGRVVVDLTGWHTTGPLADVLPLTGLQRAAFPPEWGLRGDADVA